MIRSKVNLFARRVIRDPYPTYSALRDLGPAVWLTRQRVYCVSRFHDIREVLKAPEVFISSKGVSLNPVVNRSLEKSGSGDTVLISDGEQHRRLRGHLITPMRPSALSKVQGRLYEEASQQVRSLIGKGSIEAMSTLASHLPVTVVADLVGLRGIERNRMLRWSTAIFNGGGAFNWRGLRSIPAVLDMFRFAARIGSDDVDPGSWTHRLFELNRTGDLSESEMRGMMIDYVAPSLDTTIMASGNLLHRLARHPEQWARLVEDRALVPGAVLESLRIDSAVRFFSRVANQDSEISATPIPAGSRVLLLYAAGNRDERRYESPDSFDVGRDSGDHLAFGSGVHTCAGAALAKIEMEVLLNALLDNVSEIKVGTPRVAMNNLLYGFSRLPLELIGR
jgi:cytochrome P450